jgi:hypothetical protein
MKWISISGKSHHFAPVRKLVGLTVGDGRNV